MQYLETCPLSRGATLFKKTTNCTKLLRRCARDVGRNPTRTALQYDEEALRRSVRFVFTKTRPHAARFIQGHKVCTFVGKTHIWNHLVSVFLDPSLSFFSPPPTPADRLYSRLKTELKSKKLNTTPLL